MHRTSPRAALLGTTSNEQPAMPLACPFSLVVAAVLPGHRASSLAGPVPHRPCYDRGVLVRWGLWRRRSLIRALALGLVTVTLLVACDPILHPEVTVREAAGSGVRFRLLSGDGNFVVVQASGPGATVPGPGWWRVDRRDGSVVALPDATGATRISRDGSRVLLALTAGGPVVWADGTVLTPPAGAEFSDDLTFAVFVDADGTVKTWETATQAVAPVEPGFPRPRGTTSAAGKGVSDDGRTVQYTLSSAAPIERFVDLDAGVAVDRPNQSFPATSGWPVRATVRQPRHHGAVDQP
jgi:hypothetical protein